MAKERKYLHTFSIDRSTWKNRFSEDGNYTLLLNREGQQCCIGFLAESCGVARSDLLDRGMLEHLDDEGNLALIQAKCPSIIRLNKISFTDGAAEFYKVNDGAGDWQDTVKSRSALEKQLTRLFAEERIKVTFRGKYPAPVR